MVDVPRDAHEATHQSDAIDRLLKRLRREREEKGHTHHVIVEMRRKWG